MFDGDSNGVQLHEGLELPNSMLSAESGQMQIRFITDALQNAGGFSAVFSSDCPDLEPGEGMIWILTIHSFYLYVYIYLLINIYSYFFFSYFRSDKTRKRACVKWNSTCYGIWIQN